MRVNENLYFRIICGVQFFHETIFVNDVEEKEDPPL